MNGDPWERLRRANLRCEARMAEEAGIDITQPGWRDKYLAHEALLDIERDEFDRMIATPHVDDAIKRMELQFDSAQPDRNRKNP